MLGSRLFRPTLNKKLVAIMVFLNLSLIFVLVFLYYQTERTLYNEFERQTSGLLKAIQIGIGEVSGSGGVDEKRLKEYLARLNQKGVNEISIVSTSDRIVSSTNPQEVGKWITKNKKELIFKANLGGPASDDVPVYNVTIPVMSGETLAGYIQLKINTEHFSVFLRTSVIRRVIAASLLFGVGTILAFFLAKRYTKPIENVVAAARKVAAGDLNQELAMENRKDEIGDLSRGFNYMLGRLREEQKLRERLRKAEHLAGIGYFSQSIAHEIKNPLNFMSLSVDHIREAYRPDDAEKAEKFESILLNMKKEILRVSRFAESFLKLGKPITLNLQKTDMVRLTGEVVELVSAKARKDQITVKTEFRSGRDLMVDPELIKACLYNIVTNAFQAMPGGGVLKIGTSADQANYMVTVTDTGGGMPEGKSEKVFDPFFTTKMDGVGLGLAFTKMVVVEHGGKIFFQSEEGRGSTITITLPLGGDA